MQLRRVTKSGEYCSVGGGGGVQNCGLPADAVDYSPAVNVTSSRLSVTFISLTAVRLKFIPH